MKRNRIVGLATAAGLVAALAGAYQTWPSARSKALALVTGRSVDIATSSSHHDHDEAGEENAPHDHTNDHDHDHDHDHAKDHDHEGEDEANADSLALSEQARHNLGLKVQVIELATYWRSIQVPGFVAKYPGRSERGISAVTNGVIQKVHASTGQSVKQGDPLFDFQITDEMLAASQSGLLKTLRELEVIEAKLARVTELVKSRALPVKDQIELEYERGKLEAACKAQSQEMALRGISQQQLDEIVNTKTLLRHFTVAVPTFPEEMSGTSASTTAYTVAKMEAYPGKAVRQGEDLCDLAFHTVLNVVGQAFEKEAELIGQAVANQWPITASFDVGEGDSLVREGLKILYTENSLDPESRTFRFYVPIVNEVVRDNPGPGGAVYRSWRFKPGQRARLRIPVQLMKERIVLPADAAVKEGGEVYVFRAEGERFTRVSVQVDYQDSQTVVLANDGSLSAGESVALNNAYQINLQLKNRTTEHSGHDHDH